MKRETPYTGNAGFMYKPAETCFQSAPLNHAPHRIVICAKDVSRVTGLKPDTARKLLARIRKKLNKSKNAFITIFEFCDYTGFKPEWVYPFLTT